MFGALLNDGLAFNSSQIEGKVKTMFTVRLSVSLSSVSVEFRVQLTQGVGFVYIKG